MCGTKGALVSSKTVENLIQDPVENGLFEREIFSLCMDKDCEMAYFSADYGFLFLQRQIKVSLDYKEDVAVKYICYCNQVTEESVRKAVVDFGCRTVKEVLKNRGPVITEKCRIENPFGYCCMPDIKRLIEEVVKEM